MNQLPPLSELSRWQGKSLADVQAEDLARIRARQDIYREEVNCDDTDSDEN